MTDGGYAVILVIALSLAAIRIDIDWLEHTFLPNLFMFLAGLFGFGILASIPFSCGWM